MSVDRAPVRLGPEQTLRVGLLLATGLVVHLLSRAGETLELGQPRLVPLPAEKRDEATRLLGNMLRGENR